jgi:hypothetical protein
MKEFESKVRGFECQMEEQVLKQKHRESQMKELESKGKQLED